MEKHEKHEKLHLADPNHIDVQEFAEQLGRRIDRVEESVDRIETRLSKQEHWQSFVFGAAAATGALIGAAFTAWGLLK